MSIGEKIQQLRKSRGLSQEQLADSLKVSRQAISKWETDQSNPEIENILALSRVFSISTDELLGNDAAVNPEVATPQAKERKQRYGFARRSKDTVALIGGKGFFILFTTLCVIAAGVCIIVNLAYSRQISWAAYPLLSVLLGWLVISPLFFKKYTMSMCVLTVSVAPFLYAINELTPGADWFIGLGIPLVVIGAGYVWVIYWLHKFTRIDIWYKAALTVFVSGVVVNPLIDWTVDRFLRQPRPVFITLISAFSCFAISVLLGMAGYMKYKMKYAADKKQAAM
ncbi:MAG: helix-turn-helix domain-containing protein [Peptococcaceae bacterium]|nr:helix-turn-helix domain-containing protein [Peptococcaceae bacterium]